MRHVFRSGAAALGPGNANAATTKTRCYFYREQIGAFAPAQRSLSKFNISLHEQVAAATVGHVIKSLRVESIA